MNITSSYQVRIVNCSVNLIDTVRIYQEALSYLIGVVSENWDAVKSITTGALEQQRYIEKLVHGNAVITDLKMPGMDGLALIHELKKRSFTGPILVLSNYSDFDSVRTALTDGAYDYFLKINMNGESIGEHLEKMADLLRVQQQRQTEEDHRSFAIEAQKKENALIHCAQ